MELAGRGLFVNRDVGPYEELFVDTGDDIIVVHDGVWLCGKAWHGVSGAWPLVAVRCMHELPLWLEELTVHHTFCKDQLADPKDKELKTCMMSRYPDHDIIELFYDLRVVLNHLLVFGVFL